MRKQPTYKAADAEIIAVDEHGHETTFAHAEDEIEAMVLVKRLNELTEIVNSGLGIDDVIEK